MLRSKRCRSMRIQKRSMREKNCDTEKSTAESTSMCALRDTGHLETTISTEDVDAPREEIVANQAASHSNVPSARSLPNILRSSNARTSKSYKVLTPGKTDTFFGSGAEDTNASLDPNATLPSVDLEKESRCNKMASPKSHHQRKQVHNPLDVQYDMLDWNNNKDKDVLRTNDEINSLRAPPSQMRGTPMKKLKLNNSDNNNNKSSERRCLFKRKSKRVVAKTSNTEAKESDEQSDFDSRFPAISGINIMDDVVMQDANLSSNNAFTQYVSESNATSYMSDFNGVGLISNESSDITCDNSEVYNLEKIHDQYNVSCNAVISGKSTEFEAAQYKAFQKDALNCGFSIADNDPEEGLTSRSVTSNFLFASNILYTCDCKNCNSSDEDVILYEDSVPSCANGDEEIGFSTSYTSDLYIDSDYYQILGDNPLKDFDKKNLCFEEVEGMGVKRETASTGSASATKFIANDNPNASIFTEHGESQKSQVCHVDKVQDIYVKSCPAELITPDFISEPTSASASKCKRENVTILDETNHLNLESTATEESKASPENVPFESTAVATSDAPVSKGKLHKNRPHKNKKASDVCVIQCAQCGRLFKENNQFRKHFTHCSFYEEHFNCHVCNRIYRYKSSLVQHLKVVHHVSHRVYQKFYTCNKCDKLYVRFRAFQRHLLLHDDDWYGCDETRTTIRS